MFFKRLNGKSQKDVVSALNVRICESSPFFCFVPGFAT
jgi:hypothetical protein